jgi:hypothetical protein
MSNPHEILLSKEQMAFFVMNTFAHDPALHDFGPSKKSNIDTGDMAGSRLEAVHRSNPHFVKGGQSGGTIIPEDILAADVNALFSDECTKKNIMIKMDAAGKNVEDVLMIDIQTALSPINLIQNRGQNIVGLAPGYVHFLDRTYTPFEFSIKVNQQQDRSILCTYSAVHDAATRTIVVSSDSDKIIQVDGSIYHSFSNFTSTADQDRMKEIIIANYEDVLMSYINLKTLIKVSEYGEYLQAALYGNSERYDLIINEDGLVTELVTQAPAVRRPAAPPGLDDVKSKLFNFISEKILMLIEQCKQFEQEIASSSIVPSLVNNVIQKYAEVFTWFSTTNMAEYNEAVNHVKIFAVFLEIQISLNNLIECDKYRCVNLAVPEEASELRHHDQPFVCRIGSLDVSKYLPTLAVNLIADNMEDEVQVGDMVEQRFNGLKSVSRGFNHIITGTRIYLNSLSARGQALWCLYRLTYMVFIPNLVPPNTPGWYMKEDIVSSILGMTYPEDANQDDKYKFDIAKKLILTVTGAPSYGIEIPYTNPCKEMIVIFGDTFLYNNSFFAADENSIIQNASDINFCTSMRNLSQIISRFSIALSNAVGKMDAEEEIEQNEEEINNNLILSNDCFSLISSSIANLNALTEPWTNETMNNINICRDFLYQLLLNYAGENWPTFVKDTLQLRNLSMEQINVIIYAIENLSTLKEAGELSASKDIFANLIITVFNLMSQRQALEWIKSPGIAETLERLGLDAQAISVIQKIYSVSLEDVAENPQVRLCGGGKRRRKRMNKKRMQMRGGGKKNQPMAFTNTATIYLTKLQTATSPYANPRNTKSEIKNQLSGFIQGSTLPYAIKQRILAGYEGQIWRFNINMLFNHYVANINPTILKDQVLREEIMNGYSNYPAFLNSDIIESISIDRTVVKTIFIGGEIEGTKVTFKELADNCKKISDDIFAGNQPDAAAKIVELSSSMAAMSIKGFVNNSVSKKLLEGVDEYQDMITLQEGLDWMLNLVVFLGVMISTTDWGGTLYEIISGSFVSPTKEQLFDPLNISDVAVFFSLLTKICLRYVKLAEKAEELVNTKAILLTSAQKTASGYALGCIMQSILTEMRPIIDGLKSTGSTPLLDIEMNLIENILSKNAGLRNRLEELSFGNNDTALYTQFITFLNNPAMSKNWVGNSKFFATALKATSKADKKAAPLMFQTLNNLPEWANIKGLTGAMLQSSIDDDSNNKFYINNAVTAKIELGNLMSKYFCPIFSVMDNMPQCGTTRTAALTNGLEWGILDIVIHDGTSSLYSTSSSGATMIYRVRVIPGSEERITIDNQIKYYPISATICAYLQINGQFLINVGGAESQIGDWPDKTNSSPAILCPLYKGGPPNPLDAKTCLTNIFKTLNEGDFAKLKSAGYETMLDYLSSTESSQKSTDLQRFIDSNNIPPDPRRLRRRLLEQSFVKSLGDTLQELNGVTTNGGYMENPKPNTLNYNGSIVPYDNYRLQLSNDRPSGIRALLMLLYGQGSIRANAVAGYLTAGRFAVAGRQAGGGGGRRRNRKTRKKRRIIKKSKRKVIKKQRKSIHRKRKKRKSKNRRRKY